jgi:hypothetical protein
VTGDATGDPLAGMRVNASSVSGSGYGFARTDASGNYTIGGLPSNSFKVTFFDCSSGVYVSEFYNGKRDLGSADLVSVSLGATTAGIDAALAVVGSPITGTITVHKTLDSGSAALTSFCFTLSPDPGNGQVCATETAGPTTYHQVSNTCSGDHRQPGRQPDLPGPRRHQHRQRSPDDHVRCAQQ